MHPYVQNLSNLAKGIRRFIVIIVLFAFISTTVQFPSYAQTFEAGPRLPAPGVIVHLSPDSTPAHLVGMTIHSDNALKFDFLIHRGDSFFSGEQKKSEYKKLVKYFLASLTIPENNQWVNLSPYEKNRIIKDDFGKTEMGRDLLAQDYILKQITASLIYPEEKLGRRFWDEVYARAWREFHTTQIPVNTFNKVWIIPDEAAVYESGNTVYVLRNHLKVMLEEDYLAREKDKGERIKDKGERRKRKGDVLDFDKTDFFAFHHLSSISSLGSQIIRQIILPRLEREVNEGKNFANLRQIYSGMILATWYKYALKESLLGKVYANKARVKGVEYKTKTNNISVIYQRYLQAFKKGVFNYIKEDVNKYTREVIPRKYFSGGALNFAQGTRNVTQGYQNRKVEILTPKTLGPFRLRTNLAMKDEPEDIDAAAIDLRPAEIAETHLVHKPKKERSLPFPTFSSWDNAFEGTFHNGDAAMKVNSAMRIRPVIARLLSGSKGLSSGAEEFLRRTEGVKSNLRDPKMIRDLDAMVYGDQRFFDQLASMIRHQQEGVYRDDYNVLDFWDKNLDKFLARLAALDFLEVFASFDPIVKKEIVTTINLKAVVLDDKNRADSVASVKEALGRLDWRRLSGEFDSKLEILSKEVEYIVRKSEEKKVLSAKDFFLLFRKYSPVVFFLRILEIDGMYKRIYEKGYIEKSSTGGLNDANKNSITVPVSQDYAPARLIQGSNSLWSLEIVDEFITQSMQPVVLTKEDFEANEKLKGQDFIEVMGDLVYRGIVSWSSPLGLILKDLDGLPESSLREYLEKKIAETRGLSFIASRVWAFVEEKKEHNKNEQQKIRNNLRSKDLGLTDKEKEELNEMEEHIKFYERVESFLQDIIKFSEMVGNPQHSKLLEPKNLYFLLGIMGYKQFTSNQFLNEWSFRKHLMRDEFNDIRFLIMGLIQKNGQLKEDDIQRMANPEFSKVIKSGKLFAEQMSSFEKIDSTIFYQEDKELFMRDLVYSNVMGEFPALASERNWQKATAAMLASHQEVVEFMQGLELKRDDLVIFEELIEALNKSNEGDTLDNMAKAALGQKIQKAKKSVKDILKNVDDISDILQAISEFSGNPVTPVKPVGQTVLSKTRLKQKIFGIAVYSVLGVQGIFYLSVLLAHLHDSIVTENERMSKRPVPIENKNTMTNRVPGVQKMEFNTTKGGVDFNPANMNLLIKRDGSGVPLPLGRQDMAQLNRIRGFEPDILSIRPAVNLPIFKELQQKFINH